MQKYIIEKSIKELKEKFYNIKREQFHKSLRYGPTGIGYTFETLIGKKEDSNFEPDFKGIEIKTKIGYSKSPLTLFSLTGISSKRSTIYKYIVKYFGYYRKDKYNYKSFSHEIYANSFKEIKYSFLWRLKVDYQEEKIKLLIMNRDFQIVEDDIYWSFDEIKKRLYTKLNYLAIIKGYPYIINKEKYYKYVSLKIYKLKNFECFIELFEKGIIFISFNINKDTRNIEFRINIDQIEKLFNRIE